MIEKNKNEKALRIIHKSIVHIKMMISQEKKIDEIFKYVDEIEYLPLLLLSKDDETKIFEQQLKKISKEFEAPSLWLGYNEK